MVWAWACALCLGTLHFTGSGLFRRLCRQFSAALIESLNDMIKVVADIGDYRTVLSVCSYCFTA